MLRLTSPVALAGQPRPRAAHPRVSIRHPHAPTAERLDPSDFGLGQLFVHTRDAVVVGNLVTGRIALWNPAAERLFGWSAAEAIGQPIEILIPPAIVRLHQQGLALFRRAGEGSFINVGSGAPIEVPALTCKGEEIRVELSLATLEQPAGGQYVLAMLRDASDRRRADLRSLEATRAESARTEAEQTLREHQRLLDEGTIDLQRELARLELSVQRLAQDPKTERSQRQADRTRVVEARTYRLRRALDQLATFAAIKAGILELQPERVNLVPLVGRVVSDMRSRGTPCRVNVSMPQGLTAHADPLRIEQVVESLLELAIRRNPHGCWIDVDLRRPLVGLARLEIRDTGRPLSVEQRERLLDPSAADRGLALCHAIVELHGGTLTIELPSEGGVRVAVTLPTQPGRVLAGSG
jgi:PAS domain S-box-containing protein